VDSLTSQFIDVKPSASDAIRYLESLYKCGVCCADQTEAPEITDVWQMSIVVSFTTSKGPGWAAVAAGDLRWRPPGDADHEWHEFLVDSYDFQNACFVANSWGIQSGNCG
jgi:hypothetical protein